MVTATTSKYCFDLTIIFLGHNNEGKHPSNHLPILFRLGNIDKLTFWVAAILDYKMATTESINQSIPKIEFLYCLACDILSKQLLDGVHFAIQDGGLKKFPFKWKHWFLVSERYELSKNVYIYNSPKNMNENT